MGDQVIGSSQVERVLLSGELHRAAEIPVGAVEQYEIALARSAGLSEEEEAEIRLRLADCLIETREYRRVREVLDPIRRDGSTSVLHRARAAARCGWADFFLGDVDQFITQCGEAVSALLVTPHHEALSEALRWLGHGYRFKGDTRRAFENFRDALAAARRGSDPSQQAFSLEALGQLARLRGRYSDSVAFHRESLRVNTERGARKYVGFDWFHIGLSQIYLGDWASARESLDTATRLFVELGDERAQIPVLIAWSRLDRRRGESSSARSQAERALALARETSYKRAVVLANEELADLAREADNAREAVRILETALEEAEGIAPEGDLVYEVAWRLALALLPSDPARAEELASRSLDLAQASGDRRETGSASVALALIRSRRGRHEDAMRHVNDGIREFEAIEAPFELAGAHEAAATIAERLGEGSTDDVAHLFEARRLYSRLGASHLAARLEEGLAARMKALSPARPVSTRSMPATSDVLAHDARMKALFDTARALAPYDSTVLIEGETGSGKELVARLLHEAGPRHSRPFVPLNCAALPAALLESELFGHRRGAFTGADRDYRGRLAAAEDGTVLLDEIDKASMDLQAKLLRVMEDRRVHPVGSTETVPLRARIVCATNRDLRALADRGAFLSDLYFRLTAFRLHIPPLRERPDDLHALVRHYLDICSGRFGVDFYSVSRDVARALVGYNWPGNVRELKNVMESAAFFARATGVIELSHLPREIVDALGQPGGVSLPARIEELERSQIELALTKSNGNKAEAARMLGVSRKGLLDRLRRLGIE